MNQKDTIQDTIDAFGPIPDEQSNAPSDFDESIDIEQLPADSAKIKQARR